MEDVVIVFQEMCSTNSPAQAEQKFRELNYREDFIFRTLPTLNERIPWSITDSTNIARGDKKAVVKTHSNSSESWKRIQMYLDLSWTF